MDTKISHLNVNVQVYLAPPVNIFVLARNISEGGESVVVLQSTTMEDYSTISIKVAAKSLRNSVWMEKYAGDRLSSLLVFNVIISPLSIVVWI